MQGDDAAAAEKREKPGLLKRLLSKTQRAHENSESGYTTAQPVNSEANIEDSDEKNDALQVPDLLKDPIVQRVREASVETHDSSLDPNFTPIEMRGSAFHPRSQSEMRSSKTEKIVNMHSTGSSPQLNPPKSLETDYVHVAKLIFDNQHPTIGKTQFSTYLSRNEPFNRQVLVHYMSNFNFQGQTLDAAFRMLCGHLYLAGETQAIDRILFEFSKKYFSDSSQKLLWVNHDIVYVTLFSMVLLNTDLYMAPMAGPEPKVVTKKMSRKQFVQNTMELIENIKKDFEKNEEHTKKEEKQWNKEMKQILKQIYESIKGSRILQRTLSMDVHKSSDSVSAKDGIRARLLGQVGSLHSLRQSKSSLNIQSKGSSPNESMAYDLATARENQVLESNDQLKGLLTGLTDNNDRRWGIPRKQSIVGMAHTLNAHRRGASQHSNRPVIHIDFESFKSQYPQKTIIFAASLIRKHLYEKYEIKAKNRKWTAFESILCLDPETGVELVSFDEEKDPQFLCLLHSSATALPPPGYSDTRPHVFSLHTNTGDTFLFQAQNAQTLLQLVRHINYFAAVRSKEPLRGGVSNSEYGWSVQIRELEDEEDLRAVKIQEWMIPGGGVIVSPLGIKDQLASMKRQVKCVEEEIVEHAALKPVIDKLVQKHSLHKIAFSNWCRKYQYLVREYKKYTTYVESIDERHPQSVASESVSHRNTTTSMMHGVPSEHSPVSVSTNPPAVSGEKALDTHLEDSQSFHVANSSVDVSKSGELYFDAERSAPDLNRSANVEHILDKENWDDKLKSRMKALIIDDEREEFFQPGEDVPRSTSNTDLRRQRRKSTSQVSLGQLSGNEPKIAVVENICDVATLTGHKVIVESDRTK